MLAAVEAGGTKFVVAVGTGPEDLSLTRFPTTSPEQTLARTAEAIGELTGGRAPAAIGVASFGPVDLHPDSDTYGFITSTPKQGWGDTDVVGPLAAAFDVPVGFDTDVNGAALGEATWGAAADDDVSVYVTVGTGIGGGGLVHGELLHGLLHPEMGHLPVRRHPDDGFAGNCPYHGGCLEGMAAGPALEGRWGRPADQLGDDTVAAVAVEAHYLAQLVAALTYVLSPERIVLGGGVMNLDGLMTAVRERATELFGGYLDVPAIRDEIASYVVRPGLGDRSGVLGALALARRAAGEHGKAP